MAPKMPHLELLRNGRLCIADPFAEDLAIGNAPEVEPLTETPEASWAVAYVELAALSNEIATRDVVMPHVGFHSILRQLQ